MTAQKLRIVGVSVVHIRPRSDAKFVNAATSMYSTLGERFEMVGIKRIAFEGAARYFSGLRSFRPNMERWRKVEILNPWGFRQRSRLSQEYLDSIQGQFDVAFQLHPLFNPSPNRNHKYVISTDSTYRINQRMWEPHVPKVSDREHDEWVELQRDTMRNAEALFPWSKFVAQSMIDDYGVDPAKIFVIGSSGNLPVKPLTKTDYSSQIALFIGYEFERKGGQYLLKAWEQVSRVLPNAKLIIVGPDVPSTPSPDSVKWMGRINDADILMKLYQDASVFVLPSLFEPYGHVLVEAMGNGLPVIGTNICAMPEIIDQGQNGLMVPPREPEALALALIDILRNPDKAKAMGSHAYEKMRADFTWDAVIDRMVKPLQQIPPLERASQ